jgi:TolA-binding protein
MALFSKRGALSTLMVLHFLLFFPSYLPAALPSEISSPEAVVLARPVSITTSESEYGITVDILGNVEVLEYQTVAVASPPMIVVDILSQVASFKSATIPLKSSHLKDIRLGYHPEKIRVVLDMRGSRIPPFSTETIKNGLSLFLRSEAWEARRRPAAKDTKIERTEEPFDSVERKQHDGPPGEEMSSIERLTQNEKDDGEEDTALFLTGIHAYRDQDWSTAIDSLDRVLKRDPTGRYAEGAHFLIAKAYEKRYSDSLDSHFTEIKNSYTEAVQKFPRSIFVAEALLSLGDLSKHIDNTYEALGFYKRVLKNEPDSLLSMKATIGIARIMALRNERQEAAELLQGIVDKYPESDENIEARIELAKVLYEMNHFLKSLEILSALRQTSPENRYRFPELSLYLGYDFYQLGENRWSRENLLRFYNSRPDREPNHLILTKIGDTYREEGALNEAAKFYNLVIIRHPETEGAVISRIRLAELKEDRALDTNAESALFVNLLGGEGGSAREIYEKILDTPFEQDKRKSLEQLTLLRLAILQQNEKDYDKSLETLRTLFEQFPNTPLKNDGKEALKKTLQAILGKEMTAEEYANILNIYEREKDFFSMLNDPDLFLDVARASIDLKLQGMGIEMFKKADSLWQGKVKPPDLLFFLAIDLLDREQLKPALANADLILNNYPSSPYASDAYQLKGRIFFKQRQHQKAAEMFSSAAGFDLDPCKRAGILIDKGRALVQGGSPKEALAAIGEANRLRGDCNQHDTIIDREIGELFLSLGYPGEALSIFNQALNIEQNEESIILLKLKAAECYWLLDKRADSLALYDQLAALEDPFWSNLARERMEEMNFKTEMEDMKRD